MFKNRMLFYIRSILSILFASAPFGGRALIGLLLCSTAFAQTLPTLDAAQVESILRSGAKPYALVARPLDATMQRVDIVALNPATRQPIARGEVGAIRCARLHAAATGEVLCLSNNTFNKGRFEFSSPYAATYTRDLSREINHVNEPSNVRINRARSSIDGKQQAWTYFVTGHNYMDAGSAQFSTLTQINVQTGAKQSVLNSLEQWPLTHKGALVKAVDLNYWGVSFHPKNSNTFLVTAFFKGKAYLAQGDIRAKTMTVIAQDVECPSYNPAGDMIAFKKRLSTTRWAPATLHLSTMKTTVFTHIKQSVDDQIDWLNDKTLLYEIIDVPLVGQVSIDLMMLDATTKNKPHQVWLKNARSAALYIPK